MAQPLGTPAVGVSRNYLDIMCRLNLQSCAGREGVEYVVAGVIQIVLSLVGVIFITYILYGGYLWGTARGNTDKVDQGKKLIFEATIGTVIIFGAYILTAFVIQYVGEATTLAPSNYLDW